MGHFRSAIALALATLCSPALAGGDVPPLRNDPPAVMRTLASADDRVTIPIHIDGNGPWQFVVDTGSQRTVISRDLAERLALPSGRQVTIVSMTGRSAVRTVAIPRLGYGTVTVDDIEAPVLEGKDLGAAGLLGLDSLHAKRLLLNFHAGKMEISNSRPAWRDPDAIIVEARRRKGQLILLDSDANGMTVNIILDTGTHLSVGNLTLMNKLIRKKRAPPLKNISAISVTGGTLTGQLGQLSRVRIGSIYLQNLPVMFTDALPFEQLGLHDKPALLLGVQALKLFDRVAIDFGRGKIDFLPPNAGASDKQHVAANDGVAG